MNNQISWNKGLTKETNKSVKKSGETYHKKVQSGEIIPSFLGKQHKEETKKKISDSMKKAHAEGRAWNIGINHWNNEPSYPEKFFMQVIENEFNDKNYTREYVIGKFRIDFAWIDKKLAIEIDGSQHEKIEHKQRDIKKDEYLKSQGWQVLRIKWLNIFNEPEKYINIANKFIHEDYLEYCYNNYYDIYDSYILNINYNLLKHILCFNKKNIKQKNKQTVIENKINKEKQITENIDKILNSNINFSKFGWVQYVAEILNITPQKVNQWMKKNMPNFYEEKCFKRKQHGSINR